MNTAKELVDQSITDLICLLNYMVCENRDMQGHCEEMIDNVANQLAKAIDVMNSAPVIINNFRNCSFNGSDITIAETIIGESYE